ncbi:MAG: zinc-dependent peptidase [Bacteroidota bacterium]
MDIVIIIIVIGVIFFVYVRSAYTETIAEEAAEDRFKNDVKVIKANEELLLNNDLFYRQLPYASQQRFMKRLALFVQSKNFIGREIEVEYYMKMMIGAAAIKFSFGVEEYQLSGFKQILVYPEEYYSKITGHYHKGEANAIGVLAFSWKHFKEGIDSPKDNLNLGVHEFAHAYFLQQTQMNGEDPFDSSKFKKLRTHIQDHAVLDTMKQKALFRDYAFRNEMEFFAIMGEHFFETPTDFKSETPRLYDMFGNVLKQDPTKLGM